MQAIEHNYEQHSCDGKGTIEQEHFSGKCVADLARLLLDGIRVEGLVSIVTNGASFG